MTRLLAVAAITLGLALGLVACGGDDGESASEEAGAAGEAEPAAEGEGERQGQPGRRKQERQEQKGITITAGDSQFGPVLFDSDQQAIYYFDKERSSESECYGACAAAWPPVLTDGKPQAAGQIEEGLLGTTRRDGGDTQVTYDGRPLYYYVDEGPGEVRCHNITEFGGVWLAVQPNGEPVPTS
jgi:predicted lipoprotein with Yx(FWY)xxD motif